MERSVASRDTADHATTPCTSNRPARENCLPQRRTLASAGLCPPRTRPSAKIGRRAGLHALNIQTGLVTLGTPASGRPARMADGPGSTMLGARKSDGGLIAVMCCLVCQSSPCLMRPFPKKVKDSDGTNPRES